MPGWLEDDYGFNCDEVGSWCEDDGDHYGYYDDSDGLTAADACCGSEEFSTR